MSLPVELRTATELAESLRSGEIGSAELLEMLLQRCDRSNPAINAVIAFDIEGARSAAKAADNLSKDQRGALHGLPMTIKDMYEVVGMTASCGFPHLADHRPVEDAEPVARLRQAGAIFYGKTNAPVAAADHQSYNELYGTTNNPWDSTRTPGGSSGGAAAAVAAGLTPLELGSDIGGSIRCPAHFCGIYGHKPSFGVVPMRGTIPPLPQSRIVWPLSVGGPLARSAFDLELALDVLGSASDADRAAWSLQVSPSRHERLADFRVALWADKSAYPVDSRCLDAMHAFAEDLRRLGVSVDDSARPDLDPIVSDDIYIEMLMAIIATAMPEDVVQATIDAGAGRPSGDRSFPARVGRAMRTSYTRYRQLLDLQDDLCRVWARFFEDFDLIVCPVMPTVAIPHDHSGEGPGHIAQYSRTLVVDGEECPYLHGLQWPGLVTIANLPATAVPTGRRIDGMPMGVQLVGPYLEDRTPLRFAQLLERELDHFVWPPGIVGE